MSRFLSVYAVVFRFFLFLSVPSVSTHAESHVLAGIDVLESQEFKILRGKRVGLITNVTGRDRKGRPTAEVLAEARRVNLISLFAPEHGIGGREDVLHASSGTVVLAGRTIPVRSLYRGGLEGMRPLPEDLRSLDVLVFDIQDVGARFYTYLATMAMGMEAAKAAGIEFIVLDRPNPIGGEDVEGPMLADLELRRESPASYFPIPVRHGMTAGEIARLYNWELGLPNLTVVPMEGWTRPLWYDQTGLPWVAPSPNMPDLEAATLYPGIGIFEASNLSVGRGTPWPFRWIGAPWMESGKVAELLKHDGWLAGLGISTQDYTPSQEPYAGRPCHGLRLRVTERRWLRPLEVFLKINEALLKASPGDFQWRTDEARRMLGSGKASHWIQSPFADDRRKLETLFMDEAQKFRETRKPFLLYKSREKCGVIKTELRACDR